MFNNDYIMRMIEQLVAGIALIMGLKKENRLDESSEVLTGTLRKFFGLNDQSVELMPWTDLMAATSLGGLPDAEKCALLAQLIKEKADIEGLMGREEMAAGLYLKAMNIFVSSLVSDIELYAGENVERVEELIGITGQYMLPFQSMRLLFQYYELGGRYGKAEDMLYQMLDSGECREEVIEIGKAFYRQLLKKDDDALAKGNLPRNEVADGLNQIDRQK